MRPSLSVDFNLWNDQARMLLLGLMFIGGCAGSAGGGVRVDAGNVDWAS
jgi:trk system potassium uptake protein TrkH